MIQKTKLLYFNLDINTGLTILDVMINIPFEVDQIIVENGFQITSTILNNLTLSTSLFNETGIASNEVMLFYYQSVNGEFGNMNKTVFRFKNRKEINGCYHFSFKNYATTPPTLLTDIEARLIITFIQN